jgi:hypothetical protein
MASFETMHFNPAMVDSVENVRDHVLQMLKLNGGYRSRDFSGYVLAGDQIKLIPEQTKLLIACAWDLISRGICDFMNFPDEIGKAWVSFFSAQHEANINDFNDVRHAFPAKFKYENDQYLRRKTSAHGETFTEPEPNSADYDIEALLKSHAGMLVIAKALASKFYERVETETYIAAMKRHYRDYRSIFTDSPCVHDPKHVMSELMNPGSDLTKSERERYFVEYSAQSFNILAGMSAFEVKTKVLNEEDFVIANATRFNGLKKFFADVAEKVAQELAQSEPSILLQDELDGAIL